MKPLMFAYAGSTLLFFTKSSKQHLSCFKNFFKNASNKFVCPKTFIKCCYSRHFASTAAHTVHEHPKLGARLAVLRLRWSHLGANFVYLGAHNGDTTSALPKAIQKYTSKALSPVALQPSKNQRSNHPKTQKTPPKRSPQWPCKHDVTKDHPKMYLQSALLSGPAAQP